MEDQVERAVAYAAKQLLHHSEAVFHAGILIELQGRGFIVEREVPVPVPFVPSWSSEILTAGSVRFDCVVRFKNQVVVIEVKRNPSSTYKSQLLKYKELLTDGWGLALATYDNVQWIKRPSK